MKPSISYSSSLCKPLGKEPESRGGTPDVGQIAVDAVSRDKATKAPAVDSTAHLFDHLRGRVGHRSERRIRLDDMLLLFNTTRMVPGPPKHGGRYRYGRGHGRHSLLLHRPLIGEESEGGSDPSLYSNPVVSIGPLFAAAAAAAARTRARRSAVSPASSSVALLTCSTVSRPVRPA